MLILFAEIVAAICVFKTTTKKGGKREDKWLKVGWIEISLMYD